MEDLTAARRTQAKSAAAGKPEELAAALRDFFMARDAADLGRALSALGWKRRGGKNELLEAEYAFNRLFVGPGPLAAPPYSSVYLDTDPLLMGQSCLEVRALIRDLGLGFARQGGEPDDHLARELDLWLLMRRLLGTLGQRPELDGLRHEVEGALRWLVDDHMGAWVPLFQARAAAAEGLPACVRFALARLEHWLNVCSQKEKQ